MTFTKFIVCINTQHVVIRHYASICFLQMVTSDNLPALHSEWTDLDKTEDSISNEYKS